MYNNIAASDVHRFSQEIEIILNEKIRCKHVNTILTLKEHIELRVFNSLNVNFHPDNDTPCLVIENDIYFIFNDTEHECEWIVFGDRSNIEIVLHADWNYNDLIGGIALLKHGAKAAIWNKKILNKQSSDELNHDRLNFRIKEVRLRNPQKLYI